jgi:hypothetical protein
MYRWTFPAVVLPSHVSVTYAVVAFATEGREVTSRLADPKLTANSSSLLSSPKYHPLAGPTPADLSMILPYPAPPEVVGWIHADAVIGPRFPSAALFDVTIFDVPLTDAAAPSISPLVAVMFVTVPLSPCVVESFAVNVVPFGRCHTPT